MSATSASRPRYWSVLTPMPAPALVATARMMEEAGIDGLFAPQVLGPPWIPLSAAAAVTDRVLLGSGIAIAAARSPFETATAALDLDRLSGGRFVLGLGTSVLAWTKGIFGNPVQRPVSHLRETVAAIRHVVAGGHRGLAPFEGEFYRADFRELQPLAPPVRESIPIWIAALRSKMVALAAEVGDGLIGHPMWSIEWTLERMKPEFDAALAAAGRRREDVQVLVSMDVSADDPAADPLLADLAGSAAAWAERGADELILHWVRPHQLEAVIAAAERAGLRAV